MKMFFRLMLVVVLGVIAAVLDMTLWNAWRSGQPGLTPILGAVTRRGVTTADPMIVLCYMTVIFDAAFLASFITLFPGAGAWFKRKKDGLWPLVAEKDPGPPWICAHCHEENPGNFGECWKCQKIRPARDRL
jgi:hypothetical protein